MILIKLGGSIVTNKERPQSARRKTIDNILKQIKKIDEPKILVHGGGSYGHYWSVKYGMHTKPARYSLKGLSVVKNSMIELDKMILDNAAKNKLNTYSLPPTDFMNGDKPIRNKIQKIGEIAKSGLIPITYGDALWYSQKKSYILSGDVIMTTIGKILKPRLSVFVLDVDGVYSDTKSKKLIYDFKKEKPTISKNRMDVTGGMTRKISEAIKMSKSGLKVFFVNGNKPQRIIDATSGKSLKVRYSGDSMDEYVILVDENDNPIGKEEKVKCHLPNGKLHRAFTALIFNNEGKLLLTKRSGSKMLWPGVWDGTVASHPREGETYVSSAERRMPEEIGISCKMNYVNKFEYHVPYKDIGSENEICGTLIGTIDSFDESSLIKDEISEIKWISSDELKNELKQNRDAYCPWMILALYLLPSGWGSDSVPAEL